MKTLRTYNIDLSDATRISSRKSPRQLLHLGGHHYAIILMNRITEPLIAFDSKQFTALLGSITAPITDVELRKNSDSNQATIVLFTDNGDFYSINSEDQIKRGFKASSYPKVSLASKTPMTLWGLPDRLPYSKMLLSAALARHLDEQQEEQSIALTLHLIWVIFDQLRSNPGISVGDWLYVSSVKCRFAAVEHPRGIVFFYALHESPQKKYLTNNDHENTPND